MPAALTHKSILLLARRRLGVMHRALDAKVRSGRPVTVLERRLAALAGEAYGMVSLTARPELAGPLALDPRVQGVSPFAVMGSMGPDIPAFAALLAPGQAWVFDTVHKGSPDAQREHVHAGTTDFIFSFWTKASAEIALAGGKPAELEQRLAAMRAYVLGHLAHVAGDVVSHPFVNDREWHAAPDWRSHSATESALDAQVAQQVLGRPGTRAGQSWGVWWPRSGETPDPFYDAFYKAYEEALDQTYGLRDEKLRRQGFAPFERKHNKLKPPKLSIDLLRDGYRVYRHAAIDIIYGWGWGHWFGVLSILFLPLLALPPLLFALPHAGQFLRLPAAGDDEERGWWELLTLPLAATSLTSLLTGALVAALTTKGAEGMSAAGLLSASLAFGLGITFVVLLGTGAPAAAPLRWGVVSGLPAAAELAFAALFLRQVRDHDRQRASALPAIYGLPPFAVLLAFFLVLGALVLLPRKGGADGGALQVLAGLFAGLWTLGLLFLWFWLAKRLRDARIPEHPEPAAAVRPHHVRLFDDGTLFHDPAVAAPALAQRFFPTDRRPLLELWWTNPGTMTVRSERFQLRFRPEGGTGATDVVVRAPIEPLTLRGYAELLRRAVPGLGAEVVESTDPDYVLPAGATFADHGDVTEEEMKKKEVKEDASPPTEEERTRRAEEFRPLGPSAAETKYVLFHAPRTALAVRFGRRGPLNAFGWHEDEVGRSEEAEGFAYVHDPVGEGDGETAMDYAADFAALLMLGGASRLLPAGRRQVEGGGRIEELQRVFRNWNLDRRRVNEWRMLVAGGALSEEGAVPEAPEGVAEGERTARALGWVPLLRQWFDMARRPGMDAVSGERLDPNGPTHRELSRGMAWLLDMPDPAAGAGGG